MTSPGPALLGNCLVCGIPLSGPISVLLRWRGSRRSSRNPNCCTRCGAHLQEGRLVEMTVVFADISSFTEMTGRLGANAAYPVVDEFLRLAAVALTSHGAFIDKYIGDAVMAFFNVPIKRADHAAAAVTAAVELQGLLPGLSERLGVPLRASIGIASGYARVGRLGSDDIKDYTAIGDAVNLAARLQAQARAGEILVSQSVYQRVDASYPGVPAEALVLKGFPRPNVAYRLNGRPEAPLPGAQWLESRSVMNWSAVALALLGSGCLGLELAASLLLVFGGGLSGTLYLLVYRLDKSPLRTPLLLVATVIAAGVLVSLERQRRLRRECAARRGCLEMTPQESRQVLLAAGLASATLALIALELLMHYVIRHRTVGPTF